MSYVRGPDDRVCDGENMMVLSFDIGIPGLPVYTAVVPPYLEVSPCLYLYTLALYWFGMPPIIT